MPQIKDWISDDSINKEWNKNGIKILIIQTYLLLFEQFLDWNKFSSLFHIIFISSLESAIQIQDQSFS